ncbi:MAG: glycosyltransferase family 2 protein [Eggerthellaceae bacterium]|nr:glycosyltransferase family 2 protein [Eggerthellaceae bacterium]
MPLVSIVVPCYNEKESLPILLEALKGVVGRAQSVDASLDFEVVLVNDGSSDGTLELIKKVAHSAWPFTVRWASFSRNFGKEAALYAGLERARGSLVAVMDADMQDPPEMLIEMLDIMRKGDCDIVAARRTSRDGEPPVRSFFARQFYKLINRISNVKLVDGARDFRLMKRQVVDAVLQLGEYNRFSKGIFEWVGFKTHWLEYENVHRVAGKSKWNFFSLLMYSFDGIVGFSTAPLLAVSAVGFVAFVLALIFLLVIVVRAALFGDAVAGWPSLISVILLWGGLQLLALGIMSPYLARAYMEVKRRPLFVVSESND